MSIGGVGLFFWGGRQMTLFLVHRSVTQPVRFCVTIQRNPLFSFLNFSLI